MVARKVINNDKLIIFFSALLFQITGIILLKTAFSGEIVIFDPRFLQLAENLLYKGTWVIHWGVGNEPAHLMQNPFNIQKGIYSNWFPPGYAVFVYLTLLFDKSYLLLSIIQLFLFSFIPLFFYLLLEKFWGDKINKKIRIILSVIFVLNPYFLVSSQWKSDTWLITFFTLLCFLCFIKLFDEPTCPSVIYFSVCLLALFFLKAIAVFGFLVLVIISFLNKKNDTRKYLLIAILPVLIVLALWTVKNYIVYENLSLTYSNVGYNLWLGNNPHTNQFLKKHLGDGSTIEDRIIPVYDEKWEYLSNLSEYQKDRFFRDQAIAFIISNPVESLINSVWKLIGFWSPLRVRDGHWSDSNLKTFLVLLYQTPFIFLALLSIIQYKSCFSSNYHYKKLLILFILLWMLPHLLFFSTSRFRAPIDFAIMVLAIDYLLFILNKYKKISRSELNV